MQGCDGIGRNSGKAKGGEGEGVVAIDGNVIDIGKQEGQSWCGEWQS